MARWPLSTTTVVVVQCGDELYAYREGDNRAQGQLLALGCDKTPAEIYRLSRAMWDVVREAMDPAVVTDETTCEVR